MYLYEEMGLSELLDDPEIDPDGADALYAIAQCYRLGKGTQVNEELYRANLSAAARAGSEAARQELAREEPAQDALAGGALAEDLPLYQLSRLAEEGDPAATLRMARSSLAMEDAKAALAYLRRAEAYIGKSAYTPEQEQEIFLELGALFAREPHENPAESARYYGLAREMGSARAALVLSRYARTGYGCAADPVQADAWMRRAAENGDETIKYELALDMLDEKPVFACSLLDEVAHSAGSESLRTCAHVLLAARNRALSGTDIEAAWSVRDEARIAGILDQVYNVPPAGETPAAPAGMTLHALRSQGDGINLLVPEGPAGRGTVDGLPVTRDRAEWLFTRSTSHARRHLWAQCAALLGSSDAGLWLRADALCDEGAAPAWAEIGRCYLNGCGVEKDLAQARACFEKAQQHGLSLPAPLLAQWKSEEDALQRQRAEAERQAEWDSEFARCARCLLWLALAMVFAKVFTVVHVPFPGSLLTSLLSLGALALLVLSGLSCCRLYGKTCGADFGTRLTGAFRAECIAFGMALIGLFRPAQTDRKTAEKQP